MDVPQYQILDISIHALLAESDAADISARREASISIHALLAESDIYIRDTALLSIRFLSTLSLRRATVTVLGVQHRTGISIHALLAESDSKNPVIGINKIPFLSTLSLRRATTTDMAKRLIEFSISIHALLAESDSWLRVMIPSSLYFYPRSPCGERPMQIVIIVVDTVISIHALLAESDLAGPSGPAFLFNFYPRSPCGERLKQSNERFKTQIFLSTLSLRRATKQTQKHLISQIISIHALLAESDRYGHYE